MKMIFASRRQLTYASGGSFFSLLVGPIGLFFAIGMVNGFIEGWYNNHPGLIIGLSLSLGFMVFCLVTLLFSGFLWFVIFTTLSFVNLLLFNACDLLPGKFFLPIVLSAWLFDITRRLIKAFKQYKRLQIIKKKPLELVGDESQKFFIGLRNSLAEVVTLKECFHRQFMP
jgi:hypothetical protein